MKQNKLTHAELEPSAVVVQLEIDICTTSHWRLRFQFPPYEGLKAQNGAHLGKAKQIGFGVVNSFCRACSETQRNQEAAPATASEEVKTEENITSPCSQSNCSPFGYILDSTSTCGLPESKQLFNDKIIHIKAIN